MQKVCAYKAIIKSAGYAVIMLILFSAFINRNTLRSPLPELCRIFSVTLKIDIIANIA